MKHTPSTDIIQQLVEEQLLKWNRASREKAPVAKPVITVSREPGCGGARIATLIAGEFKLDLYGGKIVEEVAKSARLSSAVIATLDEKGRSMIEDWIAVMEKDRNLWSYQYMQHLVKLVGTIARHGRAVILGRGGNYLIDPQRQLRIRLIAPLDVRIKNVMKRFGASRQEAQKRIALVEADRRAYISRYFNADIAEPVNYDLVINTAFINDEAIIAMTGAGLKSKKLV
jgi:cytidylate kinase